jgi:23S rRNA (pseudouridine1915-N3)-methyltransferase
MNVTVLAVGRLKEAYLKAGVAEYEKRLKGYCKLTIVEVADEKAPESMSAAQAEAVKEKEGERLLARIKQNQYVIALAIEGTMHSSEQFAEKLERLASNGQSDVVFLIGGSLGLSKSALARANERISFSKMTFPHQLMRLILLEQIYRAFKIARGEAYHK